MRILHLTDRLTDRGGAHWHLRGVLASLRASGHEVHLAAGRDERDVAPPCAFTLVPGLEARTPQPVDLDGLLRTVRPDLVHVHTVVNPEALERVTQGPPAIITVQDHRYFCPARGKWTARGEVCREPMRPGLCAVCFDDEPYFGEVYGLTDARLQAVRRMRVVVLSRYMRRELAAAGVPPEQIEVVPAFVHGLDLSAEPDGPPCVLFAGRLSRAKGVHEAVAAWRASGLALPLVFAGTGPLREELEALGAEAPGWVPHARLGALYRRARAMVMPSRWQEPFGIVGLEALAMGTPVAAWDSGGVGEWHPGEGLLVPWGDIDGLARALREAVDRRAVAPAGFEPERLMRRLLDVYRDAARSAVLVSLKT